MVCDDIMGVIGEHVVMRRNRIAVAVQMDEFWVLTEEVVLKSINAFRIIKDPNHSEPHRACTVRGNPKFWYCASVLLGRRTCILHVNGTDWWSCLSTRKDTDPRPFTSPIIQVGMDGVMRFIREDD